MKNMILLIDTLRYLPFLLGIALVVSCSRPVAKFAYSGEKIAPAKVQFNNLSEDAETYEWDLGDGTNSKEASPSHRYLSSGNYLIRLKATNAKNKSRMVEQRVMIGPPEDCLVLMETSFGNMLIKLFEETPKHQENFVKLVEEGYYDSLLFHRVIDGFMIQGGDPASKNAPAGKPLGMGGPGYTVPAEFVDSLMHQKGALAAARTGDNVNPQKASSGSQFYIVHGGELNDAMLNEIESRKGIRYTKKEKETYLKNGGAPFLDREYTVFGQVIEGLEIIDKIAKVPKDGRDRPKNDIRMKLRVIK